MNRLTLIALTLILVLGAALALFLYAGPFYAYDDSFYLDYAHQILVGGFNLSSGPYSYGYLFVATIALSLKLFGLDATAAILPTMVEYLLIVVLVFMIGRRIRGEGFGLIAAFVAATSPYIVGYATRVLPDMLTGLVATLSIYILVIAPSSKHRSTLYFAAGSVAMLTIYVKLIGLAFVLAMFFAVFAFAVVFMFRSRKGKASTAKITNISVMDLVYVVAGMAVLLLVYLISVYIMAANPFYTILGYSNFPGTEHTNLLTNLVFFITNIFIWDLGPVVSFSLDIDVFLFGAILFFAIIGTLIALASRDRAMVLMAIIAWVYILYINFGPISLTSYSVIYVAARYVTEVAAPLSLLVAYVVYHGYKICNLLFAKLPVVGYSAVVLLLVYIIYANIGPYTMLYTYNIVIANDTSTLFSVISYVNSGSASWNHHLYISQSGGNAVLFLSFLSKYNTTYNISTVSGQCNSSYNGSLYLAFNNYGQAVANVTRPLLSNWTNGGCTLGAIRMFAAQPTTNPYINYWGFVINSTLYSVK